MHLVFKTFLEEDECLLKVFRQPLVFCLKPVLWWGTLWFLGVGALWFFFPAYQAAGSEVGFDLSYVWKISALVGALHTLKPLLFWYVNGLLMTNESLVIIDWKQFFVRKSTRIDFHNLDEIAIERTGVQSFMLNYGNLEFSKVNGGDVHVLNKLSRPNHVARIIENYRENYLDHKNFTEESSLKNLLSGMVKRHVNQDDYEPKFVRQPNGDRLKIARSRPNLAEEETAKASSKKNSKPSKERAHTIVEKDLDDTGGVDINL